jgi:hypothetical protein
MPAVPRIAIPNQTHTPHLWTIEYALAPRIILPQIITIMGPTPWPFAYFFVLYIVSSSN